MAGPNPYTYLIGWSKHNTYYYGVRFSPSCHPSDLWQKYFTSSKKVKEFRKQHGEPDIVQVRRVFDDPMKARIWEATVLRRLKAPKKKMWLNQTDHNDLFYYEGPRGPFTEKHCKKLSEARKKQKMTSDHMRKLHEGRRKAGRNEKQIAAVKKTWIGRKHSPESKARMSSAAKARIRERNDKGQYQ